MNGDYEKFEESTNKSDSQSDATDVTTVADPKNFECLTNGTSCASSNPDSNDDEEQISEQTSIDEDTKETDVNTPVKSGTKIIRIELSNGDDTSLSQFQLITDSQEALSNKSDESLEKTESGSNHSKEILSVDTNAANESIIITKKACAVNGIEFSHNSEEPFQYIEDAVDPISSGELKLEEIHKLDSKDSNSGTFKIVTINRYRSDEDTSDCSDSEDEPHGTDTVSIISDGDSESGRIKTDDIIILDHPDNQNGNKSPVIHEICSDNSDPDDCVVTAVEKAKTPKKSKNIKTVTPSSELRRSSRAIKKKKYEDEVEKIDDESDLEEVSVEDPLQSKSHVVNNPKTVNVNSKLKRKINQKKNDAVVIIDAVAPKTSMSVTKVNTAVNKNIYQKIVARGTSVIPISSKNVETKTMVSQATQAIQAIQATQASAEPILPTLTDDMYVVEAPSFIVPYVYEKPAAVPFKEFVDNLGKEIEERRIKEEQEKKAEKAKRELERKQKKERGEEVEESEEEESEEAKKKKAAEKAERKERRRRKKEEDDESWDGSSSEESDDESISDEDSQTKDIIVSEIGQIPNPIKRDTFFDLRLGKFFMDIGTNLVQQYIQTDLLHQQNRKLKREKKAGHSTGSRKHSIALLTNNLEMSKKANASFLFEQKKCKHCNFKTESMLVMQNHLEMPHLKNNMYSCSYCSMELQNPSNMLIHMEKSHNVKGRFERPPAAHQCVNCPFEDHGKGKLGRHTVACTKRYKPALNLAPSFDWEHPAKIPKLTRARAPMHFSQFAQQPWEIPSNVRVPVACATSPAFRPRRPVAPLIRPAAPALPVPAIAKKPNNSIVISPSPRQAGPVQPLNPNNSKVMCEICDGYIKDLEQLRNHMQWIHKVKIHPKMIYNRPPLNCQKCQFRFFTDQGLERHLLGSHGLVTSAIQEAANKGKDAGRCPVCGRAYQRKLLAHVSRDHSLVLKPAHLSYKCTVCTATFGMYRQFENHVYSAHSVVAKKAIDKKPPAKAADVKQTKNSDDTTPQPLKVTAKDK